MMAGLGRGTRDPRPGTRDLGPWTQDPRPGTRDPGHGTRDPGTGTRDPGPARDPGSQDPGPGSRDQPKGGGGRTPKPVQAPSTNVPRDEISRSGEPLTPTLQPPFWR